MTLLETINLLNWVAQNQPNVNGIVETGDIFDLNKDEYQQKYAAFCATQGEHEITESWSRFSFILYYVDRLNLDKSNKDEIHSTAVEFFHNFASTIYSNYPSVDFTAGRVVTFTERFSAECAGAYMTCDIVTTPKSLCPIEFGEIPGPEPESITITTYKFKDELEYYLSRGKWCGPRYGKNAYAIGQSTSEMKEDVMFNEVCFPIQLADSTKDSKPKAYYLIFKGAPLKTIGSSDSKFCPTYGYPNFSDVPDYLENSYREVVGSGSINNPDGTYEDFSIKLNKTWVLKKGESLFVLLFGVNRQILMSGDRTGSTPPYDIESLTGLLPYSFSNVMRDYLTNSLFSTFWYRQIINPTVPGAYIVPQPVLKLTTYA